MSRDARPASFMNGAWRVFELSLGEMLWSRRTIFMAIVVGSPVILALIARIVQATGIAPLRVNGVRVDAAGMFGMMIWILFLRFIVPVLGVFYGTALVADEVEDKTITYLFTRPIRRSAILVGKFIAYLVCTTLVVLPGVMLVYFLIVPFREIGASFKLLLTDLGLLALGLAAYGGLFALVGTVMKRPLVVGLVFAFGWEQLALIMPGYLRRFTLAYYLQSLVPHAMPSDSVVSLLQGVFADSPSVLISLLCLAAATAASLALAGRVVERREYVLDQ
ncbi:MAG TPA: ABC transporter permease subunit [Vicinamibacterales bacterium]|nr:ABC transporter permease subunit [Vicinamibacterales bacterium]